MMNNAVCDMSQLHGGNRKRTHILCHFHFFGYSLLRMTLPVQVDEMRE